MSVRITIEVATKKEAALIAEQLPVEVEAQSWRGLGVIRIGAKGKGETDELIEAVSHSVRELRLRWARVRYDDEERIFKANGRRAD
jgi:hypothetical protein